MLFYFRTYLKIPDVLAQCASILVILLNLTKLIYGIYSNYSFENYLCSSLILVEDEDSYDFNDHKISFSKIDEQNKNIFINNEKSELYKSKNISSKI